jgi:hypothetical protein
VESWLISMELSGNFCSCPSMPRFD